MKRTKFIHFVNIAIYILVAISALTMIGVIKQTNYKIRLSNEFQSKDAQYISLSGVNGHTIEMFIEQHEKPFTLLFPQENQEKVNVYGYYSNEKEKLPIKNGRDFTDKELMDETPLALVGQGLKNQVQGEEILINGVPYKVIGILGIDQATPVDRCIFINWRATIPERESKLSAVLDGNNTKKLFHDFEQYIVQRGGKVQARSNNKVGVSVILADTLQNNTIFALVSISFLLSCFAISVQWIGIQKKAASVFRLLGIKKRKLVFKTLSIYILEALFGIALGALTAFITMKIIPSLLFFFMISFALLFNVLIILFVLIGYFKLPISEGIK